MDFLFYFLFKLIIQSTIFSLSSHMYKYSTDDRQKVAMWGEFLAIFIQKAFYRSSIFSKSLRSAFKIYIYFFRPRKK